MKKLERVPFDESKKVRILRFLHTLSHYDSISEPGHDLSLLSEAPQVLTELFELVKSEDRQHYTEMIEIIKQSSDVIL